MATPLYPELNQDPFRTGGVMDAPDLAVRRAALKAQLGQALTPYETQRLAQRQYLEEQSARTAAGRGGSPIYPTAGEQASAMRARTGRGGIDVRSYSGSMWNGTAVPIAGWEPPADPERSADAALSAIYGPSPAARGQIDIATGGARPREYSRTIPAAPAGDISRGMAPANAGAVGAPGLSGAPEGVPGMIPALVPFMPRTSSLGSLLRGSPLDQGGQALREEQTRAQIDATRMSTAATATGIAERERADERQARNDRAAKAAIQPIMEPGGKRTRTAGEGLFILRDPNIQIPPRPRDPEAHEILRRYIGAGGSADPSIILGAARPQRETPRVIDVGGGRLALTGSAQLIPEAKPAKPDTIDVGGRSYRVGPGNKYFDAQTGAPVDFTPPGGKPMDITAWLTSGQRPEDYATYYDNFTRIQRDLDTRPGQPASPAQGAKPAAGAAPAGGEPPVMTPDQAKKLPKGTRFKTTDGRILIKQ